MNTNYKIGDRILIFAFTAIILTLFFCSCDIHKESQKTKTDTEVKNDLVTQTEVKSQYDLSKQSFSIEPIVLSEPMIWNGRSHQNAKIVYINEKSSEAKEVKEKKTDNSVVKQTVKAKQSEKTEKANLVWLYYLIGGITLLGMFALFLLFKMQSKNANAINNLIELYKK